MKNKTFSVVNWKQQASATGPPHLKESRPSDDRRENPDSVRLDPSPFTLIHQSKLSPLSTAKMSPTPSQKRIPQVCMGSATQDSHLAAATVRSQPAHSQGSSKPWN